jgi:hypothetical protein
MIGPQETAIVAYNWSLNTGEWQNPQHIDGKHPYMLLYSKLLGFT